MENLLIPTKSKLVSAVIPTFNSEIDIDRLLESFESLDWPKEYLEIIVVDNNSNDKTVQIIEKYFRSWNGKFHSTKLIKNTANVGAASAYNIGIKNSSSDSVYIWKLDSDVALTAQCLPALVNVIMNNEQIGAVASNYILSNGNYDNVVSILYSLPRRWLHPIHSYPIAQYSNKNQNNIIGLNGASILFRIDAIKSINYFDSRYFLFFDDTDITYQLKKMKYRLCYAEESKVFHFAKIKEGKNAERTIYYSFRSQHLFCKKHFTTIEYSIYIIMQTILSPWILARVCNTYKMSSYQNYKKAFNSWIAAWKDYSSNYYGIYRNQCCPR